MNDSSSSERRTLLASFLRGILGYLIAAWHTREEIIAEAVPHGATTIEHEITPEPHDHLLHDSMPRLEQGDLFCDNFGVRLYDVRRDMKQVVHNLKWVCRHDPASGDYKQIYRAPRTEDARA